MNQLHTKVGKQYFQIEGTERRFVKQITKEGVTWTTIQKMIGRSPDTINTIVRQRILVKAVLLCCSDRWHVTFVNAAMLSAGSCDRWRVLFFNASSSGWAYATVSNGMPFS